MKNVDYNALYIEDNTKLEHIVWLIYKGMMEEYDPLGYCSTFGQYYDSESDEEVEYTRGLRARDIKKYLIEEFTFFNSDYIPAKKIDLSKQIKEFPVSKKDIEKYDLEWDY